MHGHALLCLVIVLDHQLYLSVIVDKKYIRLTFKVA
jgi:hypothetical protein